jgi:hypothetical protein
MPDTYRRLMIVFAGGVLALFLHLYLGWQWTIIAGILVGAVVDDRGWWYGGWALVLDWLALVLWNLAVAGNPTMRMANAMGTFIGPGPGWIFIIMTLTAGFGIGAVGGLVGGQARLVARAFFGASSGTGASDEIPGL